MHLSQVLHRAMRDSVEVINNWRVSFSDTMADFISRDRSLMPAAMPLNVSLLTQAEWNLQYSVEYRPT